MGMTLHYIVPETLLRKSAVLTCQEMSGSHTYQRVAKAIDEIHDEFGVRDKVVATVTDNAANFVKGFQ
jgi:hypothetical protein